MRLSYDDFSRLYFDEFEAVYRQWHSHEDNRARGEWERMRLLATITIQPHCRKRITPTRLLPLPWDSAGRIRAYDAPPPRSTPERFKELAAKNHIAP